MMFIREAFLLFATLTFASALEFSSPCPDLFHYDSTELPNQWTGTVTLLSDAELYGVWLRLIFDEKLTELHVDGNFEVVTSDNNQFLIKNRDFLLKADTPVKVKITAKYEENTLPTLTGFRLNARVMCSSHESSSRPLFPGDLNARDFLTSITPIRETSSNLNLEGCGTTPLARGGQWPWQGAIRTRLNNSDNYICEATLISSKHVLTPAHCVTYLQSQIAVSVAQLKVYLGQDSKQEFGVAKIVLNPGYRFRGLLNDLAVVQLDHPAIISDDIRPICLKQTAADTKQGSLVGFQISGGKMQELGEAQVEVIGDEECLKRSAGMKGLLSDNVSCAKFAQGLLRTVCVGDSGSSLMSLRDGSKPIWELKGIVTVGVALQDKLACDEASSLLFVDVPNYFKWIETVAV